MTEQIRLIVKYWKIKSYLTNDLKYSKDETAHTIRKLRKMEPNVLHMFLTWFNNDVLPTEKIHGVSIQDIMDHQSLNPVAAFLALNWIQIDPMNAKFHLTRPVSNLDISDQTRENLMEIAKKRGWDSPEVAPEDETDLTETQPEP